MRVVDVLFSFTETLIALACVAVLGPSLENAMIAVGLAGIPFYARTCYAAVAGRTSEALFRGGGRGRRRPDAPHLPAPPAQRHADHDRGRDAGRVDRHPRRRGASASSASARSRRDPEWGAMLSGGRDFFNRAPWLMLVPRPRHRLHRPRPSTCSATACATPSTREGPPMTGTAPLLEVTDLSVAFGAARRSCDGLSFDGRARRDAWPWSANPARARASPRSPSWACCRHARGPVTGGRALFDGPRSAGTADRRAAARPRRPDRHGVPGADDLAEPGADDRPAARPRRSARIAASAGARRGERGGRDAGSASASTRPERGSASTRTSSRAACASAS